MVEERRRVEEASWKLLSEEDNVWLDDALGAGTAVVDLVFFGEFAELLDVCGLLAEGAFGCSEVAMRLDEFMFWEACFDF